MMMIRTISAPAVALSLLFLVAACPFTAALSHGPINTSKNQQLSRRDALIGAASTATNAGLIILSQQPASANAAALPEAESVDLAAFNAARLSTATPRNAPTISAPGKISNKIRHTIIPAVDPPPLLPIRGGKYGKSTVQIPRVGYSLYKTNPEIVGRCTALALRCGVRHFDVGSLYGSSNAEIAKPLKLYLDNGLVGLNKGYYKDEKPELLEVLDATSSASDQHAIETIGFKSRSIAPPIDGSAGRRGRREQLFISHKLANSEQSTNIVSVKRSIKASIAELGVGYLDMVSIHSPLTDKERRLTTYRALLELRDAGFVRTVGVCNYGIGPLQEIAEMLGEDDLGNMPPINQLELSPFNAHSDVVQYCDANGIAVGCSAWSKLSGVDGPADGWAVLADLAKVKGVSKAQLLVRWSLQKGYVCVPRSGSGSKLERIAIAENSYGGVNPSKEDGVGASCILSGEEMKVLEGLDVGYKAGRLGRRDGWGDADVAGPEWDPTDII